MPQEGCVLGSQPGGWASFVQTMSCGVIGLFLCNSTVILVDLDLETSRASRVVMRSHLTPASGGSSENTTQDFLRLLTAVQ